MFRNRYRRITIFFARILISLIVWEVIFPHIGLKGWSKQTRSKRLRKSAVQFRNLAINMGGVLIKVGQFMSARADVLPVEITSELADLQDEVTPVPISELKKVAEADLGTTIESRFVEFDDVPLAAASLGQVHRAKLYQYSDYIGEKGIEDKNQYSDRVKNLAAANDLLRSINVVVKIQRPYIEDIIAVDLAALRKVGGWVYRYPPIKKRINIPKLLVEFTRVLYEEIDYLAEGRNAEIFAANFNDRPEILVPRVIWTHTSRKVLTLEDVGGIKITNYDEISSYGVDCGQIASTLFDTYLQQIFIDGFFHADPHPGNLFVRVKDLKSAFDLNHPEWQLTFVDFGMVGRLSKEMHEGSHELLIGVGTRDTQRVIKAYQIMGVLLPDADLEMIEKASTTVFDRFWGKSMSEMNQVNIEEFKEFAIEYRELLYQMPFQVPQDMIFLIRAIGILSGMCIGLDPDFNIWQHLVPYAKKLMAEEVTHQPMRWLEEIGVQLKTYLTLPIRIEAILGKMERGDLTMRVPELNQQIKRLERSMTRLVVGLLMGIFLISGIQFYISGVWLGSIILFSAAGITFIYFLFF